MWYFEYFGYHYSTQKLSCQKLWHLSFQTPYRTCLHEAWMCFCILIKIEDFCLISNEKVIFLQIQWNIKNHEYWQVCNFWSRMTIHMADTSLESSEFTIFEKLFFGTIWGTTFGCKVTFVRFVDIFFIQKLKWIRWI